MGVYATMKSFVDMVYKIEKYPGLYLRRISLDLLSALLVGYAHAKSEDDPYYKHYTKEFNVYVEIYYRKKVLDRLDQIKEAVRLQKEATDAEKKAVYEKKLAEIEVFTPKDACWLIRDHTPSDAEAMWEFFRLFHQCVEEMDVLE